MDPIEQGTQSILVNHAPLRMKLAIKHPIKLGKQSCTGLVRIGHAASSLASRNRTGSHLTSQPLNGIKYDAVHRIGIVNKAVSKQEIAIPQVAVSVEELVTGHAVLVTKHAQRLRLKIQSRIIVTRAMIERVCQGDHGNVQLSFRVLTETVCGNQTARVVKVSLECLIRQGGSQREDILEG